MGEGVTENHHALAFRRKLDAYVSRMTRSSAQVRTVFGHPSLLHGRPCQQGETRGKQQHEDDDPKRGLVQSAVGLQPKPGSNNHGGQPDPEQGSVAVLTTPVPPNQINVITNDDDRLESRALVIL